MDRCWNSLYVRVYIDMHAGDLKVTCSYWTIAAVISSDNADGQGLGEKSCRIALWITCYVTGGIFGTSFLVSSCGCCFRCCRDSSYDYDA